MWKSESMWNSKGSSLGWFGVAKKVELTDFRWILMVWKGFVSGCKMVEYVWCTGVPWSVKRTLKLSLKNNK